MLNKKHRFPFLSGIGILLCNVHQNNCYFFNKVPENRQFSILKSFVKKRILLVYRITADANNLRIFLQFRVLNGRERCPLSFRIKQILTFLQSTRHYIKQKMSTNKNYFFFRRNDVGIVPYRYRLSVTS